MHKYHEVNVTRVYAGYDDGRVFFDVDVTKLNPFNCINTSSYAIDPSRKDSKAMLLILLTARATGNTVSVGVEEDQCFYNYISVHRLGV